MHYFNVCNIHFKAKYEILRISTDILGISVSVPVAVCTISNRDLNPELTCAACSLQTCLDTEGHHPLVHVGMGTTAPWQQVTVDMPSWKA